VALTQLAFENWIYKQLGTQIVSNRELERGRERERGKESSRPVGRIDHSFPISKQIIKQTTEEETKQTNKQTKKTLQVLVTVLRLPVLDTINCA